ncbi:mitochondrial carrier [Microthyrium microscopicum]|uniref:Mitochondrial carrier n=1 Tax=Microthyrium microscopicum TaxID=703497 RepID=A0A6A6U482_9PEZI|nr:mitochondrial carrier [Microthyrium microscopicum]
MAAVQEVQQEDGAARLGKDLFSGAMGGIAQVLIGQPFDIVKVRLQTTQEYKGAIDCASKIWSHEGPLAFYKGTLTPLLGIGACVSVQFGAFHYARRSLEARNSASNPLAPGTLSLGQFYLAGAFAGLTNTVLSTPIEHIRIRLQTQPHDPARRLYSGPGDCIRKLYRADGLRAIFRGSGVTSLREMQAYGMWFLTFEALMNADAKRTGVERKTIATWKVALYGGLAGEALWLGSYPLDVIKSKMQTDGFGGAQKYPSMRTVAAEMWAQGGARAFWKGIGPTLARAMPVSAGTFAVAEMTSRWLG